MSDIFLSYARGDRERVRPLAEALAKEGWSVFWDRIIPVGKTWPEVLDAELAATRSLVVVWSWNSITSQWVREEADEGLYLKLPLFPVLLDAIRPPLGFRGLQAADLSAWDGTVTSPLFLSLVRDIRNSLGKPGKPEALEPKATQSVEATPRVAKIKSPPRKPAKSPLQTEAKPDKEFTNRLGMQFVLIPAGAFQMGSPGDEDGRFNREVLHQVTLTRPFYLQTTPVTQGQWQQVMGNNPASFTAGGADCPVETVSWDDAQEFLGKLNRMEQTDTYRLPTESEWEYACRAGSLTRFYFGYEAGKLQDYAWYKENSEQKTPGGSKATQCLGSLRHARQRLGVVPGLVWQVSGRARYRPPGA